MMMKNQSSVLFVSLFLTSVLARILFLGVVRVGTAKRAVLCVCVCFLCVSMMCFLFGSRKKENKKKQEIGRKKGNSQLGPGGWCWFLSFFGWWCSHIYINRILLSLAVNFSILLLSLPTGPGRRCRHNRHHGRRTRQNGADMGRRNLWRGRGWLLLRRRVYLMRGGRASWRGASWRWRDTQANILIWLHVLLARGDGT